ncbi:hypothetical protein FIBSPDRAFT_867273 [Athelia psychrophila]|uniref:Uncharacterized protein n=1 Tax=Athelia psychrophila TaxID=1759441 RepID=A0A166E3I7_9AGAM|nr:hypothetical protein FIBSPDRAFT_867273 [Fibularhizoctonia sp. CBS 109695]
MAVLGRALSPVACPGHGTARDPGTAQRDQRVVRGGDEMALGVQTFTPVTMDRGP